MAVAVQRHWMRIPGYLDLHQTTLQERVQNQDERVQNLKNNERYGHEALGKAYTIHGKNQRPVEND